ncbi:MAG: hypothetical protein IJD59_05540 [Clostridia bacterium]|nr:hypothetical protein [Clostridia bacterium]
MNNSWEHYDLNKGAVNKGFQRQQIVQTQKLFYEICDKIVDEYRKDQASPFVRAMMNKIQNSKKTGTSLTNFEIAILGEAYQMLTKEQKSDISDNVPFAYGARWSDKNLHTPHSHKEKLPPFAIFNFERENLDSYVQVTKRTQSKDDKFAKQAADKRGQDSRDATNAADTPQPENEIIAKAQEKARELAAIIVDQARKEAITESLNMDARARKNAEATAAKIVDDAQKTAEQIVGTATQEAEKIQSQAKQEIQELSAAATQAANERRSRANQDAAEIREQANRDAEYIRSQAKINADNEKKDIIEKATAVAKEEAEKLIADARIQVDNMIKEASAEADIIRSNAQEQAEKTRNEANAEAEKTKNEANAEAREIVEEAQASARNIINYAETETSALIKNTIAEQRSDAREIVSNVVSDELLKYNQKCFAMSHEIMNTFENNGDAQRAMEAASSQYQAHMVQIFKHAMEELESEKQKMCKDLEAWRFALYPRKEKICIDTYLSNYLFLTRTADELIKSIMEAIYNTTEENRIDETLGNYMVKKLNKLNEQIQVFLRQFEATITALGFDVIKPAAGEKYDSRYHRAEDETSYSVCTKYAGCEIASFTTPGIKRDTLYGEEVLAYADVVIADTPENIEIIAKNTQK